MAVLLVLGTSALAQLTALPITEEEVYLFLTRHFDTLASCDADQLAAQFDSSATVRFSHSDGHADQYQFPKYLEWFRKGGCRPYQQFHWDRYGTQVATSGYQATVRWKVTWSKESKKTDSPSRLIIEGRIQLARRGGGLVIMESQTRFHELSPGAERAFLAHAEKGSLFGAALRFYEGAIEMVRDFRRRQQTTPHP